MKITRLNVVLLLACLILVMHQVTQHILHYSIDWADNYLDPFIGAALVFHLIYLDPFRALSISQYNVLLIGTAMVLISEIVFPLLAPQRIVSDGYDVIAIYAGIISYTFINNEIPSNIDWLK